MSRPGKKKRKDGYLDLAPAFRETVHFDGGGGTAATPEDELQSFLESMYTQEMVQAAGLVESTHDVAAVDRELLRLRGIKSVGALYDLYKKGGHPVGVGGGSKFYTVGLEQTGLRESIVVKIREAFKRGPPIAAAADDATAFEFECYVNLRDAEPVVIPVPTGFTDECVENQFTAFASEFNFIEDDQPDVVLYVRANGLHLPFLRFSCMVPGGSGATDKVRWTALQRAELAGDPERLKTVVKDSVMHHTKCRLADPDTDRPTGEEDRFPADLCRPFQLRKHLPAVDFHVRAHRKSHMDTVATYVKLNETLLAINTSEGFGDRMCEVLCMRLKGMHAKIKAAVDAKLVERLNELSYTKICEIGGVPADGGGGGAALTTQDELQAFLASIYTLEMVKAAGLVESLRGEGIISLVEDDDAKLKVDGIETVKDLCDTYTEGALSAADRTVMMKYQFEDLKFNKHLAAKIIEALEERVGAAGGDDGGDDHDGDDETSSFEYVKTLAEFGTIYRKWKPLEEPTAIVDPNKFADDSSMLPSHLIIPATVAIIDLAAFESSPELRSVEMLQGVEIVNEGAFSGCRHLKHVFFPLSVVHIAAEAFADCPALTAVSVPAFAEYERTAFPSTCTIWQDGVLVHPAEEDEDYWKGPSFDPGDSEGDDVEGDSDSDESDDDSDSEDDA